MKIIDFRSDTVSCPDEKMRKVIYEASVGDAGYNDDPSVRELEELAARVTGKESGLFMASGIMGNLVSVLTHCNRGEAVLVGNRAHIYRYEAGGLSALAGVLPYLMDDEEGIPAAGEVARACPIRDVHFAQASLMCLENTHNDCGGIAVSPDRFRETLYAGKSKGLPIHLDGARIFNAAAAWGVDVKEYTQEVDSVQFCLSKGLGAPMGAVLCGSEDFIDRARFRRKRVGGELREVGFMAAAGSYALLNNVSRISEDHVNASYIADRLKDAGLYVEGVKGDGRRTNMVYFHLPQDGIDSAELARKCKEHGVLFNDMEPYRIRLVTHISITREDIVSGIDLILRELNLL